MRHRYDMKADTKNAPSIQVGFRLEGRTCGTCGGNNVPYCLSAAACVLGHKNSSLYIRTALDVVSMRTETSDTLFSDVLHVVQVIPVHAVDLL